MKYREPGYRASERHIEPAQPVRLAGCDAARLGEHDMVELKALGQRDRDERKPGLALDRCMNPAQRTQGRSHAARPQTSATCASAQITATEPGRSRARRRSRAGHPAAELARGHGHYRQRVRVRAQRHWPGAARGRSRAAAGRRSRESAAARGSPRRARGRPRLACPGGRAASGQEVAAHGVVPWAMSPSTVAAPVAHRRPIARTSIGDRSCASSTTTCAIDGVRSMRSAASSISTWSARRPGGRARAARRLRPDDRLLLGLGKQAARRSG